MLTTTSKSLGEAIAHFKAGAGWWDGSFPRSVGRALEAIARQEKLDYGATVTIEKERWETGSGPHHSYHYRYRVVLPILPQSVAITDGILHDATTALFGGKMPRVKVDGNELIFEYQK